MNRLAVVTGATGGIGVATVAAFLADGWSVAGIDSADAPPHLGLEYFARLDLGADDGQATVAGFLGELPRMDALVNNAAIQVNQHLATTTLAEWDRVMAVNLRAAYVTMQASQEALRAHHGAVVNVSSVHALATSVGLAAYAASKGGLLALTRAAALEFAADGIRVNAVLPGAVDTPMLRAGVGRWAPGEIEMALSTLGARTPLGRIGDPAEVAQAILFLADPQRSSFITGQALIVDGGASAMLGTEAAR